MYQIEFYEDEKNNSLVWNWLEELRVKSSTNKTARIEFNQAMLYIELLAQNGTRMSENYTKHLQDDIWELRPGNNRILFFFFKNNKFILLHHFRKKTRKTPSKEIMKAISEMIDYIKRSKE